MLKNWEPVIAVLMFYLCFYLSSSVFAHPSLKVRFKSDGMENKVDKEKGDDQTVVSSHNETHYREMKMRRQASVIVVIILFCITAGKFCCCRYLPEFLMDRCNWSIVYNCV